VRLPPVAGRLRQPFLTQADFIRCRRRPRPERLSAM